MNSKAAAAHQSVFGHMDAAFTEMDKAFKSMDDLFEEAQKVAPDVHVERPDGQEVHFNPKTWSERWKLTRRFAGMAFTVFFTGKTKIVFRRRTK